MKHLADEKGIQARLEIYSGQQPSARVLRSLTSSGHVDFMGSRDSEELAARRRASDFLVHVESFDRKNRRIARLSISTKIPEYMASNRNILAVGPNDVASIQYLADNDAATVVMSGAPAGIAKSLLDAMDNPEVLSRRRRAALRLARDKHDKQTIATSIRSALVEAIGLN